MKLSLLPLLLALLVASCSAQSSNKTPIEIGTVNWQRDHDAALALSAKSGKPVFALFQEVPG